MLWGASTFYLSALLVTNIKIKKYDTIGASKFKLQVSYCGTSNHVIKCREESRVQTPCCNKGKEILSVQIHNSFSSETFYQVSPSKDFNLCLDDTIFNFSFTSRDSWEGAGAAVPIVVDESKRSGRVRGSSAAGRVWQPHGASPGTGEGTPSCHLLWKCLQKSHRSSQRALFVSHRNTLHLKWYLPLRISRHIANTGWASFPVGR